MKFTYETTELSKYGMQIITTCLVTDEMRMCMTHIFEDFSDKQSNFDLSHL